MAFSVSSSTPSSSSSFASSFSPKTDIEDIPQEKARLVATRHFSSTPPICILDSLSRTTQDSQPISSLSFSPESHFLNALSPGMTLVSPALYPKVLEITAESPGDPLLRLLSIDNQLLLKEIIARSFLGVTVSLYESIMTVLYEDLRKIEPLIALTERVNFLKNFCFFFVFSYTSFIGLSISEENPSCPGMQEAFHGTYARFLSQKKIAVMLQDIDKELSKHLRQAGKKSKNYADSIARVHSTFSFLRDLLTKKQSLKILSGLTVHAFDSLSSIITSQEKSPQRTLEQLIALTRMLFLGFQEGVNQGTTICPTFYSFFQSLHKCLFIFHTRDNTDVQCVKKVFYKYLWKVENHNSRISDDLCFAKNGSLTLQKYRERDGIKLTSIGTQSQFISYLYALFTETYITSTFTQEILHIFEQNILQPMFPEILVSTNNLLNRFIVNLNFILTEKELDFSYASSLSEPLTPLVPSQKRGAKSLVKKIHFDIGSVLHKTVLSQPCLANAQQVAKTLPLEYAYLFHYIPIFQELGPCIQCLGEVDAHLDNLYEVHLNAIREFLESLPHDLLNKRQTELSLAFASILFDVTRSLAFFAIMTKDLETFLKKEFVHDEEENLLPPSFLKYMASESEIFDTIQELLSPLEKDSPKEKENTKTSSPIPYPSINPETTSSLRAPKKPFSSLKKEKVRQILKKLEKFGFNRTGGKGSHVKFTSPDGDTVVIPKSGRPGSQLSSGMEKSIERQLHKVLDKKERKNDIR